MTTLQQRRNYILASNLLLVGLVVTWLILVVRWVTGIAPIKPMRWPYLLHVTSFITFVLMAALYYAVRAGKRWTRILLLLLVGGGMWINLAHLQYIKADPLNMLSWVVYSITHIWGMVLLFRRP